MYKILHERLREMREECEYSQGQVAKLLTASQQDLSRWELGKAEPSAETLVKLAMLYHTTTDYLLGATNDKNNPRK